jgi:4-hydroxy-2-oxoheptanedioate aldolase
VKINTAKQKMLRGEPAFGYALGMGSPAAAEVLADCGIDFILLDTQHGSWGPDATIEALRAMLAGSATPMARVARNDYTMIGRLLDEGMLGIVVPMVHTPEDAQAAAAACRFPPIGARSWGWGRARAYGDDYTDWIDDQVFVAVQIESALAVENAEAILATPGVDGCWIGPSDLALSMGIHPRDYPKSEEHARAVEKVVEACKNTGKVAGFACAGLDDAVRRAKLGYRYLTAGSDMGFLVSGARNGLKVLRGG